MHKNAVSNENKGFSLVELIVVVAIMAVLTSMLAPALLQYVEKSRAQKDESTMGEVTNAVKIALADQDVYDECLVYNIPNNFSCYSDDNKTSTTVPIVDRCRNGIVHTGIIAPCSSSENGRKDDDWHYDADVRVNDEEAYGPDGCMRGMTISFTATENATNSSTITLANAEINKMSGKHGTVKNQATAGTSKDETKNTTLENMQASATKKGVLYGKLVAAVGKEIDLVSQTYRNSEYTVFVRMSTLGNNEPIVVYGQWNGTNLTK